MLMMMCTFKYKKHMKHEDNLFIFIEIQFVRAETLTKAYTIRDYS